ncbi:S9 family peptidase [Streptomyces parvulus]|uniref:S9 family peptidase n=1 Tax=Streptomyces parvulus TaxID=146923 RepID=A0A369V253_9ACTN|nr:prolyl oligopeptidase family serine peptidase [Streptomyces parvulus]RDD84619.1 S9 family peptidase [Streptomyces parvulus]
MALPDIIPIEELFAPPARTAFSLSPDGMQTAHLASWRGRPNVRVEDVDRPENARWATRDPYGVERFLWTVDSRWLLYVRSGVGDRPQHLFRADPHAPHNEIVDLTPGPGTKVRGIHLPSDRMDRVILQVNMRNTAEYDLVELDIGTGRRSIIAKRFGSGPGWFRSRTGDLFRMTKTAEGDLLVSRRNRSRGTMKGLTVVDGRDRPLGPYPVQITPDGAGAWVGSDRGTDRTRLIRVDLRTREECEVDSHSVYDLDTRAQYSPGHPSPLILARGTGELLGARYLGERQVIHALDPGFAEVLENVAKLSDGDVGTISSDLAGRRWIVTFTHDRDPATYFYDRSTGESRVLSRSRQTLDPAELAPMRPVTITARDGLPLPACLTLPLGVEPVRLPTVLLVHGGRWWRDSWGFDPVVQLLANRGYAVLQVNARGSTGYGKTFTRAGTGRFAAKVHDDLVDGVRWAVDHGYADANRVAIMGTACGGYAALAAAASAPEVFAAAVDVDGTPDEVSQQAAEPRARPPVGPAAERIRTPWLLAREPGGPRAQLRTAQLVDSLRARGVPVEHLHIDNRGGPHSDLDSRIAVHAAVERFLAIHLSASSTR